MNEPHAYDIETLRQLSTIQLKEILHEKNIDSTGIYEPSVLIRLIMGQPTYQTVQNNFPESYLMLFDKENKRNAEALERIKCYLKEEEIRKKKEPVKYTKKTHKYVDEEVLATVVENMPARYSEEEIRKFLSRAGLVKTLILYLINKAIIDRRDIDNIAMDFNKRTRTVVVQYETKKGAQTCKQLFHNFEVAKGIRLTVTRDTPLTKPKQTLQSELNDLKSSQLTIVRLQNMFTSENVEDRQYMKELREDVEDQCRQYGMMTGIAINEKQFVVLVRYSTEEEAVACLKGLDGRLFDGRKITAELAKEENSDNSKQEEIKKQKEEEELLNDFFASIAEEEEKFKTHT